MKTSDTAAVLLLLLGLPMSGIIPVLGQSGANSEPLWINFSGDQDQTGFQSVAALSQGSQFFLSGLAGSNAGMSGFFGNTDGLSNLSNAFSFNARDARLFHSDYSKSAHYSGATFQFFKGQDAHFSVGVAQIEASGVEDRINWFAGAQTTHSHVQIFRVEVAENSAAHAVSAGFTLSGIDFNARYLRADDGTGSGLVKWQMPINRAHRVALEFQSGSSERFRDGNYQRVLFSYSGSFNRPDEMWGTEGGSSGLGTMSTAILAASAVGVALVASSGSDKADTQIRFTKQHDAAKDVLNKINPTSVSQNLEYGGWVYQNADATFSATEPIKGTVDSVNIGSPDDVPNGYATASYHTHAAYDPRYDSENFSQVDIAVDNAWRVDGYLATPMGYFKYHNYLTGVITTLGQVAN